jgi:hypothetical protein
MRVAVALFVSVVVAGSAGAQEGGARLPDPGPLLQGCSQALAEYEAGGRRSLAAVATACQGLYQEKACRTAWARLDKLEPAERTTTLAKACHKAYCPLLKGAALCRRKPQRMSAFALIDQWPSFHSEILRLEAGPGAWKLAARLEAKWLMLFAEEELRSADASLGDGKVTPEEEKEGEGEEEDEPAPEDVELIATFKQEGEALAVSLRDTKEKTLGSWSVPGFAGPEDFQPVLKAALDRYPKKGAEIGALPEDDVPQATLDALKVAGRKAGFPVVVIGGLVGETPPPDAEVE